jgi:unsaturated rhamnogalacturonyl hydrolase
MKSNLIFKTCLLLVLSAFLLINSATAQTGTLSVQLANTFIRSQQDALTKNTQQAFLNPVNHSFFLQGIDAVWRRTANGTYFDFYKKVVDQDLIAGRLDDGKAFLTLYKVTEEKKYFDAASTVFKRFQDQPNHKDDFHRNAAFIVEYAALTKSQSPLNHVVFQLLSEKNILDQARPGSPTETFLAQYGVAIVDVLDYIPENDTSRKKLIRRLNLVSDRMKRLVSERSNSWVGLRSENASLFLYTLAKADRLGYVHKSDHSFLEQGFIQLGKHALSVVNNNNFSGGSTKTNAFDLLAVNEMEIGALLKPGKGHLVLLDSYFNNEIKMDQSGNLTRWHYKWEERGNNGFSMWGGQFMEAGFHLSTLYTQPTGISLAKASVFLIVDPDSEKENKTPNFIQPQEVETLSKWVKGGGVLVLMANDSANVELDHFNTLAGSFGIQFNKDSQGKVTDNQYEMGAISIPDRNAMFKTAKKVFIKEFSSLSCVKAGQSILKDRNGNAVVCVVKFGKGSVLLIGDPWLYNEYVDGRKLPNAYDNFKAGADIINWISAQIPKE